jgi:hypothetical protein
VDPPPSMPIHKPNVPWHASKAWLREKEQRRSSIAKDPSRMFEDVDLENRVMSYRYGREMNPPPPPPTPDIHPYVMNFTSPIDLLDSVDSPGTPRAI